MAKETYRPPKKIKILSKGTLPHRLHCQAAPLWLYQKRREKKKDHKSGLEMGFKN
jgi:hypothetical protein